MEAEGSSPHSQVPSTCTYSEPDLSSPYPPHPTSWPNDQFQSEAFFVNCSNMTRFYGEKLLAPRPTPKLEDHPLSAIRDCLINIFAATLHVGGRSFILNLTTHHAVVTGTHLSHGVGKYLK